MNLSIGQDIIEEVKNQQVTDPRRRIQIVCPSIQLVELGNLKFGKPHSVIRKQVNIYSQIFRIRMSIVVHKFFSRGNIPGSSKEYSSFTLAYHYIFLLRETCTINESNPGRSVHWVRINEMGDISLPFYLLKILNSNR